MSSYKNTSQRRQNKKISQRFVNISYYWLGLLIVVLGGFVLAGTVKLDVGALAGPLLHQQMHETIDPNDGNVPAGGIYNTGLYGRRVNDDPTNPIMIGVVIFIDEARAKFLDFSCASGIQCSPGRWTGFRRGSSPHMDKKLDVVNICLDVPAGYWDSSSRDLIHMRLQVLDASRPFGIQHELATSYGTCADQSGQTFNGSAGVCLNPTHSVCTGTGGFGTGFGNTGQGGASPGGNNGAPSPSPSPGTSTSPTNSRGGGGGGGSSATSQGDAPASVPTSSGQGDQEQPKIEPSPFFDGKEYAKGSAAGKFIASLMPGSANRTPAWIYAAVGGTVLAALGGVGYVWWRKTRSVATRPTKKTTKKTQALRK